MSEDKVQQALREAGLAFAAEVKRLRAGAEDDFASDKITQLEDSRHKDQETLRQIACRPHSSFTDSGWREHALRRVASLEKMYQDAKRNMDTLQRQCRELAAERDELQSDRLAKADALAEAASAVVDVLDVLFKHTHPKPDFFSDRPWGIATALVAALDDYNQTKGE